MKYSIPTFVLALGLLVAPLGAQAQIAPKTPAPVTQPALFDVDATASLATRKAFVHTKLSDLLAQLTDIQLRVQTASTRLGQNNIDVTAANSSLTLAQSALATAKAHLDLFALTPASEKPATMAILRAEAKASEEALKYARAQLIKSIVALKLTLQTQ